MSLPSDAFILMSVVNTKLRDYYPSLDALCDDLGENKAEIVEKLANYGFGYDESQNRFI